MMLIDELQKVRKLVYNNCEPKEALLILDNLIAQQQEIEKMAVSWKVTTEKDPLAWLDSPETLEEINKVLDKSIYAHFPAMPIADDITAIVIQTIKQLAKSKTNDSEGV